MCDWTEVHFINNRLMLFDVIRVHVFYSIFIDRLSDYCFIIEQNVMKIRSKDMDLCPFAQGREKSNFL